MPQQRPQELLGDPLLKRRLNTAVGYVADVVQVVRPSVDAVRDEQVLVAVVVQVGEERSPAPVGRVHAGQIADLAEPALAAIDLQGVPDELGMQPGRELELVDPHVLGIGRALEDLLSGREHVEDHHVRPAVVGEVGGIDAHRREAGVPCRRGDGLGERTVAVVEVEKVVLVKIVGHEEVGAAIEIQIADDHAQTVSLDAAKDARLLTDVHEAVAVVPEESVAGFWVTDYALRVPGGPAHLVGGMVQEIHVQVAVSVVVEEGGLGRVAHVLESVLCGPVGEGAVAVIDVEHIPAAQREVGDVRHVDVEVSVAIHVGHRDPGRPAGRFPHPGA